MLCFFILLHRNFQPWLTLFTAVIFVLHYLNDELKIQGSRTLDYALAILIFSCVLSYSAAFVSKLFPAAGHAPLILCLLSLTCFILFAYYILRHGRTEKIFLSIFLFGNVVIPLLITFSEHISAQQLLGFIVLFHYTRWYIHYFQKFSGKSLITYWDIVLGSHVLILLLFFLFITMPQATTLLFIFFSPIFFYGWTIIHILLSIRKSDYTILQRYEN